MDGKMNPSSSKHEPTNTCRLFQLPYPIILNILSRVPIDDLFPCRCVCKRFLCFISDPEFARLQLSRSPLCMLVTTDDEAQQSKRLQLAHLDADGANFQVSKLNFTPQNNVPSFDYGVINACNGLLLLGGPEIYDPSYVCNPILGEFISIPPPYTYKGRGRFWGLGYSKVTNQYKVLQSYNPSAPNLSACGTAEIYTIGTGRWRSIGNAPNDYVTASLPFNAFLNGALHWSHTGLDGSEFIHTFDFDVEQFGTVPPPDHSYKTSRKYTTIGVLGGCLFVIYFTYSLTFDIWVMKEYGKKESWTKQFVIENLYPICATGDVYQPMFVLSNGEILIWYCNKEMIVCYNRERKDFRRTDFFPTPSVHDVIAYTPSFVSLYNVAKGEQISRLQTNRVYDRICTTQEFQDYTGLLAVELESLTLSSSPVVGFPVEL